MKKFSLIIGTLILLHVSVLYGDELNTGVFRVGDYGTGTGSGGYYFRGYAFTVTKETTLTHLIGAGTSGTFSIVLAKGTVTGTGDDETATGTEILRYSNNLTGDNSLKEESIEQITLNPGITYILAQGRNEGSGSHVTTPDLYVNDLLTHPRIASWRPTVTKTIDDEERDDAGAVFRWTSASGATNPEQHILDTESGDINDFIPRLGFRYLSDYSAPAVSTLSATVDGASITFKGKLDATGGDPDVSLFIEWGTQEPLSEHGTLTPASPSSTNSDNTDFLLTITGEPNTTYYYRAVAINEVDRAEGAVLEARMSDDYVWTGQDSKDWETPGNWDKNAVPVSTSRVKIPETGNNPEIPNNISVVIKELHIENNATLTIKNGGKIEVIGKLKLDENTAAAIVVE